MKPGATHSIAIFLGGDRHGLYCKMHRKARGLTRKLRPGDSLPLCFWERGVGMREEAEYAGEEFYAYYPTKAVSVGSVGNPLAVNFPVLLWDEMPLSEARKLAEEWFGLSLITDRPAQPRRRALEISKKPRPLRELSLRELADALLADSRPKRPICRAHRRRALEL